MANGSCGGRASTVLSLVVAKSDQFQEMVCGVTGVWGYWESPASCELPGGEGVKLLHTHPEGSVPLLQSCDHPIPCCLVPWP